MNVLTSTTLPLGAKLARKAGLREVGDVRGITGVDANGDGGLELFGAHVLDIDAGGGLEVCDGFVEGSSSSSVKGPNIVTTVPLNSPAMARSI